jgi:hypothetical protein
MEDPQHNEGSTGWYPCPPPEVISLNESIKTIYEKKPNEDREKLLQIFDELNLKYIHSNQWNSISKQDTMNARRFQVKGVEVRKLPKNHFLAGEYGLFATRRFEKYDILGEYTGKIVDHHAFGHYVAALEDKSHEESLGIDAQRIGNEMRFINSYLQIAFSANVTMHTAYINTYPHILIVCCENIEINDEILLDYGAAYNNAYLLRTTTHTTQSVLSVEELAMALPFNQEEEEEDEK